MTPQEKLISIAEQEVGYCEKSKIAVQQNPSVLDEKVAGAGADNYTKYGRSLVNWIGAPYSQGNPWCDLWCDWVFITAFGIKLTKEMIGGWSAYTPTSAQYYKNMGRWYGNPEVGDQIFFKNDQRICHTGIVYKVDKDHVYTIEGNTSSNIGMVVNGGCVAKKSYALTYSKIAGYGRPRYELVQTNDKPYLYKGVDVSAAQKVVDYSAIKASGVEFAILKIIRKDLQPDAMFEKHYVGFTSVGIPIFAVYNYSYATTVDKAITDANQVLKILGGRRIPVCLDVEDNSQQGLGKTLIDIINAYQNVIESAGLPFMLYTGQYFYGKSIEPWENSLKCKDIWMARYYKGDTPFMFKEDPDQSKKPLEGIVGWQYTSKGHVVGYNSDIDLDIIYMDISAPAPVVTQNIATIVNTNGSRLNIRNKPRTGTVIGKLANGIQVPILDVYDGWYKIGDNRYVSPDYIKSNTTGIITASALNIRTSDSKKGAIVGTYRKGDTVIILRQSSTGWYLTQKGWVSNNYVKRC